jgi:glycogen synthase
LTPYYGERLGRGFADKKDDVTGILNGIDDVLYDPLKIRTSIIITMPSTVTENGKIKLPEDIRSAGE